MENLRQRLPASEIEAADLLLESLAAHRLDIDAFDRGKLVMSGAVVAWPELRRDPEKADLVKRAQIFATRILSNWRRGQEPIAGPEADILFHDYPPGAILD